jgi:hypothetical protein
MPRASALFIMLKRMQREMNNSFFISKTKDYDVENYLILVDRRTAIRLV